MTGNVEAAGGTGSDRILAASASFRHGWITRLRNHRSKKGGIYRTRMRAKWQLIIPITGYAARWYFHHIFATRECERYTC